MRFTVDRVEPGRSAGVTLCDPGSDQPWRCELTVEGREAGTLLTVAQSITNRALAPSTAAGGEYYLDRLVAFVGRRDPGTLDFDEYFLGQADHYRRLFPLRTCSDS
jgi:hypothetical protein